MTAVTPDLLDALEEAAKGARPGYPWYRADDLSEVLAPIADLGDDPIADAGFVEMVTPDAVLALVAEVRRLREVEARVLARNRAAIHEALYGDLTASEGETVAGSHDDGERRSGAREGKR